MKKILSIVLAMVLMLSCSAGVWAIEDSDVLDSGKEASDIQLMTEAYRPEVELFETMDKSIYVGTYWQGEVLHVIPVPDRIDDLNDAIANAIGMRNINMPKIVIDSRNVFASSTEPVYSMADRNNAHTYLIDNMETLKIEAVGYTADKLLVFMIAGASEDDKKTVIEMSPVKAIKFKEGGLFVDNLPNDVDNIEQENVDITPRITATGLRGGNWVRRSSTSNWSTIAVSAVRNWNNGTGDIGFITCGHGWTNGQNVYASDGALVGTADVRLYNNMDVTFVKLNNTSLNSRGYMKNGKQITQSAPISEVDVNKKIEKYGARTGNTTGYIEGVGIKGKWSGYEHSNLFLTSVTTRKGDSGCAFVINGNTIVGLMVGARSTSGTSGPSDDPTYDESVVLPIMDVMSGPKFLPSK